jgi:hypothetical protein
VAPRRWIGKNVGMRLAKVVLNCLICLGISTQGFASVSVVGAECPMAQAGMDSTAMLESVAAASHDCCADAATFAKSGRLCKSAPCQSAYQAGPLAVHVFRLLAVSAEPFLLVAGQAIRLRDPSPVWRPPALI